MTKDQPKKSELSPVHEAFLRRIFNGIWPLSEESWQVFLPEVKVKRLARGDVYIRLGDPSTTVACIYQGLLRAYYVNDAGADYTHAFFAEGSFCTAYAAALENRPVAATFEALEDSIALEFPVEHFRGLFLKFPEWNHIGRILVEQEYISKVRRIEELLAHPASARFSFFTSLHQKFLPRLKQVHLASYLGITPESLSRLRGKKKK